MKQCSSDAEVNPVPSSYNNNSYNTDRQDSRTDERLEIKQGRQDSRTDERPQTDKPVQQENSPTAVQKLKKGIKILDISSLMIKSVKLKPNLAGDTFSSPQVRKTINIFCF